MQQWHQMGAITDGKGSVSVNPDCLIVYSIELSCLLINRLSSPERILTAAVTGLWEMAKGGAKLEAEDNKPTKPGTETEDNKPAEPEIETENKQAEKTSDSCTCNCQ